MKRETAEQAKKLLNEIGRLKDIRAVMIEEEQKWWALSTPSHNRIGYTEDSTTMFPERLRKGFVELVNKAITEAEVELEQLKDE